MKNNIISVLVIIALAAICIFLYTVKDDQDSVFHSRLISDNLVEHGNGLIKDDVQTGFDKSLDFASMYYFKGSDVSNYFKNGDSCFRIVNITSKNYIKLMYVGTASNNCENITNDASKMAFSLTSNVFEKSEINTMLKNFNNKIYNHEFDLNDLVVDATWYIGSIKMSGNQLSENIEYERGIYSKENSTYESKLGLISITDYLKAGCGKSIYDAIETCGDDNSLYNDTNYWTINNVLWDSSNVYTVTNGMPKPMMSTNQNYYVFPSFYLKANLKVTGNGTPESPYILK